MQSSGWNQEPPGQNSVSISCERLLCLAEKWHKGWESLTAMASWLQGKLMAPGFPAMITPCATHKTLAKPDLRRG